MPAHLIERIRKKKKKKKEEENPFREKVFLFSEKDMNPSFFEKFNDEISWRLRYHLGIFRTISGLHLEKTYDHFLITLDKVRSSDHERYTIYGFAAPVSKRKEVKALREMIEVTFQRKRFSHISEMELFLEKGILYVLFLVDEKRSNDMIFSAQVSKRIKKEGIIFSSREKKSCILSKRLENCTHFFTVKVFQKNLG